MRRYMFAALVALASGAACANLDGLSGGSVGGGPAADAAVDGPGSDGQAGDANGGMDSEVASDAARPSCALDSVPDLVGYYNLDENGGSVAHDCSPGKHDGVVLRVGPTTWSAGIKGGGLLVASPNGCVELATTADFVMKASFTVMAWMNTKTYPASTTTSIVGKANDLNVSGWRMYTGFVNELGAGVARPSTALYVGQEPVDPGTWHHLTTVFAPGTNLTFFIDGVNVAEKGWPDDLIEDTTTNVRIGCRGDNTGFVDGIIDEVRIYSRALTSTEIALLSAKP